MVLLGSSGFCVGSGSGVGSGVGAIVVGALVVTYLIQSSSFQGQMSSRKSGSK